MKQVISSKARTVVNGNGRIGLLGFGKTNKAILDILSTTFLGADITVYHSKKLSLPSPIKTRIYRGGDIIDSDLLFVSPSVRRENLITAQNTEVTSDTELFFNKDIRNLFLVTGSDGKSTVSSMTADLLRGKFPELFLGGNIGTPIAHAEILRNDAFVVELSSFNLRYTKPRSLRALITNITPNHLNWHDSYEEYRTAKENLLTNAKEPIVNVDTTECASIAERRELFSICSMKHSYQELRKTYSAEHIYTVTPEYILLNGDPIFDIGKLVIKAKHNIENFTSAVALTYGYCDEKDIMRVAQSFKGLPHRCEIFSKSGGVSFIDSSIDTTPTRTCATLNSLGRRVRIILGGRGKGLDPSALRDVLIGYAERIAIYGDVKDEFAEFIESDIKLRNIPHKAFYHFDAAVEYATESLMTGDTVILSPAATSYGEFNNFEERGARFREIISNKYEKI